MSGFLCLKSLNTFTEMSDFEADYHIMQNNKYISIFVSNIFPFLYQLTNEFERFYLLFIIYKYCIM